MLVILVEWESRFCIIALASNKKVAQVLKESLLASLRPIAGRVHALTYDNGKELEHHDAIAEELKAEEFFAHPYHSWGLGLNENANGLYDNTCLEGSISSCYAARYSAIDPENPLASKHLIRYFSGLIQRLYSQVESVLDDCAKLWIISIINKQTIKMPDRERLAQEIRNILISVLQLDDILHKLSSDKRLIVAFPEFDSMAALAILTTIEEHYQITIEDDEVDARIFETIDSLTDFLMKKLEM